MYFWKKEIMGVIFTLYKKASKEYYTLGKPKPGNFKHPSYMNQHIWLLLSDEEKKEHFLESHRCSAFYRFWSICGSDNYTIFKIPDLWDRESLSSLLYDGSLYIDNMKTANKVAKDIIRWAGNDELVMVADTDDPNTICKKFGFTIKGYKETGSLHWN